MGTMTEFPEHELSAYRADPEGDPRGAVVVVQEIWGLTDHITDVADRFAAEGYVAVAPDLLAHVGLTAEVGSRIFGRPPPRRASRSSRRGPSRRCAPSSTRSSASRASTDASASSGSASAARTPSRWRRPTTA